MVFAKLFVCPLSTHEYNATVFCELTAAPFISYVKQQRGTYILCVTTLPPHCPTLHTHEKLHHLRMDRAHNSYKIMAWIPPLPATGHVF